jgi:hypothetical protein
MEEHGWEPAHTTAPQEFSYSMNLPERWFARWVVRFYLPTAIGKEHKTVDALRFVSIHFAADHDSYVDEPLLIAGICDFQEPLPRDRALKSYGYWFCKSWFWGWGNKKRKIGEWHEWDPSEDFAVCKSVRSFSWPLYEIKSSEQLEKLIFDRLFSEK